MLRLMDIRNRLISLLSENFEDVYVIAEDISQIETLGYKKIFPFFHIQIESLKSSNSYIGTRDESLLVDITYMSELKTDNETMYSLIDRLKEVIDIGFYVKTRFLKVAYLNAKVVDDLLHISFYLSFNNGTKDSLKEEEKMNTLNLRRL